MVIALILLTAAIRDGAAAGLMSADTITAPFRDAVYNHSLDESEAGRMYRSTLAQINAADLSESETERGRALTAYYLGRYHQAVKSREEMASYAGNLRKGHYLALRKYYTERNAALEAYRIARGAAEKYLELEPGAPSHSLLGEILGQMLFLGNAPQALSIGPKARKEVKKALELDPDCRKALIQEASRLAYSPPAYGGNPEEARNLYRRILRNGAENREDEFNIYGGFAMAAFMEKNDEQALSWFNEALRVYPGNVFALGMSDYLREALLDR
jgi:tetratricopeptide (TPR) repeat protein